MSIAHIIKRYTNVLFTYLMPKDAERNERQRMARRRAFVA